MKHQYLCGISRYDYGRSSKSMNLKKLRYGLEDPAEGAAYCNHMLIN